MGSLTKRIQDKVINVYQRDDNSKLTAGLKETITRNKIEMQKRLLTETVEDVHKKFQQENKDIIVSYTSFYRLRPFWVVPPRESDRDNMCL